MKKLFAMVLCCLMLVPLVACDGAAPEAYNSPTIQSTASQPAEMEEVEATPTPTPIPTPTPTPTPTPVSTPTPVPVISTPTPVQSAGVFVGSVQSDKYHYPSCRYAKRIIDYNEIWFSSAADAQSHGYVACKVCHPPS